LLTPAKVTTFDVLKHAQVHDQIVVLEYEPDPVVAVAVPIVVGKVLGRFFSR
jgi:hypothetical protein